MKMILVHKQFSHADDIYPVEVMPGKYNFGKKTNPADGVISRRCAEVAIENEWAEEIGSSSDGEPTIIDKIVGVIPDLDPEKDYTASDVPKVEAIEALLEEDITADQRDEAVAVIVSEAQK